MSAPSLFPPNTVGPMAHTMNPLRFAIQVLSPRSCPPPRWLRAQAPPPAGLRVERSPGAGGNDPPPALFSQLDPRDWAPPLVSREWDFGHITAVLIVVMGLAPFASIGLW